MGGTLGARSDLRPLLWGWGWAEDPNHIHVSSLVDGSYAMSALTWTYLSWPQSGAAAALPEWEASAGKQRNEPLMLPPPQVGAPNSQPGLGGGFMHQGRLQGTDQALPLLPTPHPTLPLFSQSSFIPDLAPQSWSGRREKCHLFFFF